MATTSTAANTISPQQPIPEATPTTSKQTNPITTATTSTSNSNINQQNSKSALVGATCMELALEGERLCKTGDFKNGVRFFEEAIKVGTNDDRTLSAIYSQLGNAYFYMEDYQKALEYHKLDVELVHNTRDEIAEAKACGNLGNTYKMLGKFDEALVYCRRYYEISNRLNDSVGKGRALYNLGNVYHTQGKRMIGASDQEPGELSNDIKDSLKRAIKCYEENLGVVRELQDFASMGRAYGNLGNTHYLLGNFELAVENHKKRLELARQTNDKSAERRAHLNLGNANVFLGNFQEAIENYSATLKLAQELQDKYTEAHSCYSLANTYTFLRDYKSAVFYHLKYLDMIKEFDDKLGEGRACWSLVNIYQMVNDPESALIYAKRHYEIAELLGDKAGLNSAKINIDELEEIISQKNAARLACGGRGSSAQIEPSTINVYRLTPDKLQEQEQRRFKKQLNSNLAGDIDGLHARRKSKGTMRSSSNERLFDMIANFQSGRIDEQRCEIAIKPNFRMNNKENVSNDNNGSTNNVGASTSGSTNRGSQPSIAYPMNVVSAAASAIKATYRKSSLATNPTFNAPSIQSQRRPTVSAEHREQLFDLIAGAQGQRMDEQRASLPALTLANGVLKNPRNPGLLSRGQTVDQTPSTASKSLFKRQVQVDTMPETIIEVHNSRDKSNSVSGPQPSSNDAIKPSNSNETMNASNLKVRPQKLTRHFQTVDSETPVHDEKFLDSLMKYQSTRFNDQRSEFPRRSNNNSQNDKEKNQTNEFFNLIVRFQSDRIDDQRSTPPTKNKNVD